MREAYPVFIAKDKKDFLVYVPDFEIYTEGVSYEDAIKMARDAIGLAGITLKDDNCDYPVPSSYEGALGKAKDDADEFDYSRGILTLVDIDFDEYRRKFGTKTVRRNIMIPEWLDYEAEKSGINVSEVVREALMERLNILEQV